MQVLGFMWMRAGMRLLEGKNYAEAAEKLSEGLRLIRGGVTGERLATSIELYTSLAQCCLNIAEGNDARINENINNLPAGVRTVAFHTVRRQFLERTYAYSTRALSRLGNSDSKARAQNHFISATACLQVAELSVAAPHRVDNLRTAAVHFGKCLALDSSFTGAQDGFDRAQEALALAIRSMPHETVASDLEHDDDEEEGKKGMNAEDSDEDHQEDDSKAAEENHSDEGQHMTLDDDVE